MTGVLHGGRKQGDILPAVVYWGYDDISNTHLMTCPYFEKLIPAIYELSLQKAKDEYKRKKNKPNEILPKPSHSFMINANILSEKNKRAVEIVFIIITLIEQAGKNVPHISAQTILERNPALKAAVDASKSSNSKNTQLKRAFWKAWELLSTKTYLKEKYKNIQLPDPEADDFSKKWIPTASTLDKVFEFPHDGKTNG